METASYSQSAARLRTRSTICCGVNVGPEDTRLGSVWPEASSLTFVPPMSIARMEAGGCSEVSLVGRGSDTTSDKGSHPLSKRCNVILAAGRGKCKGFG